MTLKSSMINPYLDLSQFHKPKLNFEDYIDGILKGDRIVLSKAITLIESEKQDDKELASRIIQFCLRQETSSFRIGVTGVPGVGKSTFIESFGLDLISRGHKVAVLAVDPSSEKSGGSILGDRTRMENLSKNANAYIRPSPSKGSLGGVARRTREVILLCEAAGYDRILVETVGVGQSETLVYSMVDFFLLLILPGAGDELQGIKRGIIEMADGILITKSDGDTLHKAKIAKTELERVIPYFFLSENFWKPFVICISSLNKTGFSEFYQKLDLFEKYVKENLHPLVQKTYFEYRREQQSLYWFDQTIFENFKDYIKKAFQKDYEELRQKIKQKEISPFEASENFFKILKEHFL